jgi:hypothetical protein
MDTRWFTYRIDAVFKLGGFILPTQNSLNDGIVARIVGYRRAVGCVPTPMNEAIVDLRKALECGKIEADPASVERLKAYVPT